MTCNFAISPPKPTKAAWSNPNTKSSQEINERVPHFSPVWQKWGFDFLASFAFFSSFHRSKYNGERQTILKSLNWRQHDKTSVSRRNPVACGAVFYPPSPRPECHGRHQARRSAIQSSARLLERHWP